jgi:tetratricopeptide (TPR) repeat protein
MRPREQPPSATMVASAQWVEEASRAIDVGDYDRATSLLERAVSVEPNNGRAFYYYGLAMGERGRPGAALSLLQKAEILLQGNVRALGETYAQMGTNLERLGRRPEAVRRYEQALTQDPSNTLARRRLEALRG